MFTEGKFSVKKKLQQAAIGTRRRSPGPPETADFASWSEYGRRLRGCALIRYGARDGCSLSGGEGHEHAPDHYQQYPRAAVIALMALDGVLSPGAERRSESGLAGAASGNLLSHWSQS
jgi:hypothetical protein